MNEIRTDVAVIGGGPAGLAAALKARESGCEVLVLERDFELGGILQQCIHVGFGLNYFKEELSGPEYAQRFVNDLGGTDVEVLTNTMVVDLGPDRTITAVNPERGVVTVKPKAVVLAMGCRERTRGAINIPGYRPAGIFPAGQAQRFVNMEGYLPGRTFVILGSGDIGMIMARRLTLEGCEVKAVVEVLPYTSGLIRNQVQCLEDYGIPLILKHTITSIHGRDRVEGVTIAEVDAKWRPVKGTERYIECDSVLFSVGLIPENELSQKAGIQLDPRTNGAVVNELLETSVPGVFAAGNVLQVHDLVDWVTMEAQRAGENAARFVREPDAFAREKRGVTTEAGNNVGYVVPQRLDYFDGQDEVQFSFRPRGPAKDQWSLIMSGGKILRKRKHQHVIPSEMINTRLKLDPADVVDGKVLVTVVSKEELEAMDK
ncbi:MAG: NAD(P)/FAD-dependent oxidoreductase [Promethearchaeota archaeon]